MPRDPRRRPYSVHEREVMAARRNPHSAASTSAHPFATAGREGRLRPSDPLDAITIAFAAAVDEILHAREARLAKEQPNARQRTRTVTADLARSLGMSAQTLRETRDGDRWVTLSDVLAVLARRSDVGPVYERHLEPLLRPWPYLLHKDALGHPTPSLPRASDALEPPRDSVSGDDHHSRLKEAQVLDLERTARDAITMLAEAQGRAALAGRALPSDVDWSAVHRALDPFGHQDEGEADTAVDYMGDARPRPGQRTPGAKAPADYGIDNVNGAVRAAFADGRAHTAAEVIALVQDAANAIQVERGLGVEPLPDDTIRNALWRLHSQPRDPAKRWLVHEDGTYRPGPRMLGELEEKGTNRKP